MTLSKRMRYMLLAATVVAGAGGVAVAQNATTYDLSQLPATKGRVAQYSLSPRGDVDGLILEDGTQIHLPPHLGTQLVFVAKPGDAVTVRGLKARNVAMVQAMQVTNDATNSSVTDNGPPARQPNPQGGASAAGPGAAAADRGPPPGPKPRPGAATQPLEAQGVVKAQLHGPKGDLNGVVLQDGTIVRLPPPEAAQREAALATGQTVFVRGDGMESALGRVIAARAIGTSAQDAVALKGPPPNRDGRGPGPGPGRGANAGPAPAPAPAPAGQRP